MAGIIKSPRFAAQARLLETRASSADEVDSVAEDVNAIAAVETAEPAKPDIAYQTLERRNAELESMVSQLQARIDELEQDSARQDYAQGYEQGQLAGYAEARTGLQEEIKSIATILENVHEQGQVYLRQLEQVNVESIFTAVSKIIGKTVEDSEAVRQLVREQLSRLATQNKIVVHLAPQDYQLLLDGKSAENGPASENVRFIADDHIQYGGCIIETDGGGLDARLEIQMQQFKDMLLDVYARRQAGDL